MEQFTKVTTRYPVSGSNVVEKIDYTSSSDAPEQGRVWINKTQYIEGVLSEIWNFRVGGYQVCHKWLKDRKGRNLSFNDTTHYQHIIANLAETILLMRQIDQVIDEHGSWPIQ
jgi:hypothetical protein